MASIFSRIVKGEIPCYKIDEDDKFLAFLDVFPLVEGHTLIVPKTEIDYIFDIDDVLLSEMMLFAKRVAKKVGAAMPCKRVGIAVVGLEVPHAHIHLIPINNVSDMNFANPKLSLSQHDFEAIAKRIVNANN